MLNYYYNIFLVTDRETKKIDSSKVTLKYRKNLEIIVESIFNALDSSFIVDEMLRILDNCCYHTAITIFSHIAEIHLFKVTEKESKLSFEDLNDKYPSHNINKIRYKKQDDSSDEEDL